MSGAAAMQDDICTEIVSDGSNADDEKESAEAWVGRHRQQPATRRNENQREKEGITVPVGGHFPYIVQRNDRD